MGDVVSIKEQDWALIIQENEKVKIVISGAGNPSRIYKKVLGTSLFVLLAENHFAFRKLDSYCFLLHYLL